MGRRITLNSKGEDVTCMKQHDALVNPCGSCSNYDCPDREFRISFPETVVIRGKKNAKKYLKTICNTCGYGWDCDNTRKAICDYNKDDLKNFFNLK